VERSYCEDREVVAGEYRPKSVYFAASWWTKKREIAAQYRLFLALFVVKEEGLAIGVGGSEEARIGRTMWHSYFFELHVRMAICRDEAEPMLCARWGRRESRARITSVMGAAADKFAALED